MQHLTDYYILYLLLICRIFLKYGTGNVMNNKKGVTTNSECCFFMYGLSRVFGLCEKN